jgi:hypothetical protein
MGDSSSFTRQKLASAVTGGYLALRRMGGSKPNSTFAAVQHTTHRPTPRANKSYYNGTSPSPTPPITPPDLQTQVNNLNFNGPSVFTSFNNLLRNAPSGVVQITNSSLISYYNSLTPPPSPTIPSGTVFYGLAGTNIPANVFSGLTGRYVLIPETGITIGSSSVTISGNNLVIGGTNYPIGSQVTIGGTIVDFLIIGSPAIIMPIPIFNLDPIKFDFASDFGENTYLSFSDNLTNTDKLNITSMTDITKIISPNPVLSFSNINLEFPVALKFTPTVGPITLNTPQQTYNQNYNNLNSGTICNDSFCALQFRIVVNAPCKVQWCQIVTLDNLTTNQVFDLTAVSGGSPSTLVENNIAIGTTAPHYFSIFPKLNLLTTGTEYFLVIKVLALGGLQRNLKMQALFSKFET